MTALRSYLTLLETWTAANPMLSAVVMLGALLLCGVISYALTRSLGLRTLTVVVRRTGFKGDDAILDRGAFDRLAWLVPVLFVHALADLVPMGADTLRRWLAVAGVWVVATSLTRVADAINDIYNRNEFAKSRPIKGYLQIVKMLLYLTSAVFTIALLFDRSPWVLLSGLGAATAVLLLIFRDTILSLVASVQIASNDMIQIGDWIEMPKYDADGDVIDIALHTVKIRNWDKTITTIPTHKMVEDSFKNWRGMRETGGRRIKRAVFLDQSSVRFVDDELLRRIEKMHLMAKYIPEKKAEIAAWNAERNVDPAVKANGRRMTNLGTFRAYLDQYLKTHPRLRGDLTMMVRHLQPTAEGLPIEIYCFTDDTRWPVYEGIQADIVDHVLAVLSEFDLRVFQSPGGYDMRSWGESTRALASAASESAASAPTPAAVGSKAPDATPAAAD